MKKLLNYFAYASILVNIFGVFLFLTGLGLYVGNPLIYICLAFIFGVVGLFSEHKKKAIYGIIISLAIFLLGFSFIMYLGSHTSSNFN